jgi:hypothetical protein
MVSETQELSRPRFQLFASDYTVTPIAELPDDIGSLAVRRISLFAHEVFAGTRHRASIYRISRNRAGNFMPVAIGMGTREDFGSAEISGMAFRDLDQDGTEELIAITSQVTPRGQPRTYIWSVENDLNIRGMTVHPIKSSWSHGIAFGLDRTTGNETVITAFCGFGEVIETRLSGKNALDHSFTNAGVESRLLTTMPASGEQAASGYVGISNRLLVLASGFKEKECELRIYQYSPQIKQREGNLPDHWRLIRRITEEKRFANVRVLLSSHPFTGQTHIVAWWCTELFGGDAEMISYAFGNIGPIHRRNVMSGQAIELWPTDNHFTAADLEGDGNKEIWFATESGRLWRWDPTIMPRTSGEGQPKLVAMFPDGIGAIQPTPMETPARQSIYISSGRKLAKLGVCTPNTKLPWATVNR